MPLRTPMNLLACVVINTGSFELAGGTLRGKGAVIVGGQLINAGVVAPGLSAGVITAAGGNYIQDLAGTLAIEIGGISPFEYDRLNIVNGSATLGGLLAVSLIDTGGGTDVFQPNAGDMFEILTAAGGLGGTTFAGQVLPTLSGGLFFDVLYSPNAVTLAVLGVLGDYNRNGAVDAADYVVWRNTLGRTGAGLAAAPKLREEPCRDMISALGTQKSRPRARK